MKDLSLQDCIELQDCFLFDGKFSPFENTDDFLEYFPLVLVGEIGGLINVSCKLVRTPNIYTDEIEDECADIFIYLLLFGRMLEIHEQKEVFNLIESHWNFPVAPLQTEKEYYASCLAMLEKALHFLQPGKAEYYNGEYFCDFFLSILQVSNYITKKEWRQVINKFHEKVIQKHTDPNYFTLDGLYKGSFRINIEKLLAFADSIDIQLPEKRISFLRRVAVAQSIYFSEHASEKYTKRARSAI